MSTDDRPFDLSSAIGNYRLDTIYQSPFRRQTGKYFNLVVEESGTISIEYEPPFPSRNRLLISISFIKERDDIQEITIRRFMERKTKGVPRWEEQSFTPNQPIRLTHFSFEKLTAFLGLLSEHNLANINTRRLSINADNLPRPDDAIQSALRALLAMPDAATALAALLNTDAVTTHDIINIGYRKAQLRLFRTFLDDPNELLAYGETMGVRAPEKIWQHFLKSNPWIFGFGLDYRFLGILQDEATIGTSDIGGANSPISDFLLGSTHFTVLVELKRPNTPLFRAVRRKNRANSWALAHELTDAVSQILEQKASWEKRAAAGSGAFLKSGKRLLQKTVDPKCFLIIGADEAFDGNDQDAEIKLRTFELYRRDSRNIEIITYSELYERAEFIVSHPTRDAVTTTASAPEPDGYDDIPF